MTASDIIKDAMYYGDKMFDTCMTEVTRMDKIRYKNVGAI